MASKFKIGDLVWAKMKGFPAWPAKIVQPKPDMKSSAAEKKQKQFVFFLGSENYAWVPLESIWSYVENKERFMITQRVPRGFHEAVDAMEVLCKKSDLVSVSSATTPVTEKTKDVKPSKSTGAKSRSLTSSEGSKQSKSPASIQKDDAKQRTTKSEKQIDSFAFDDDQKDEDKETERRGQKRTSSISSSSAPAQKTRLLDREPRTSLSSSEFSRSIESPSKSVLDRPLIGQSLKDFTKYSAPAIAEPVPVKNIIATPMKIGFLGLGIIGSGIVNNLLLSGHEVTVWNRSPSKCKDFVRKGALKGNSPSEVVQSCDITFSCVTDPSAVKDVVFGNCGVLQGIGQGKSFVDMSTVDVETVSDIHEAITARSGRFLEAPVIGSKQAADDGQLVILAAGDRSLFDDCHSCFQAMGSNMFYMGEVGYATRMILVVRLMLGTTLAGLAECLALGEKIGLDKDEILQVLALSPLCCPLIKEKGMDMSESRFSEPSCKLQVLQKDLRLAINMSDVVEQPLHVGSAVNELFKKGKAKGYGEHDTAAVFRAAAL